MHVHELPYLEADSWGIEIIFERLKENTLSDLVQALQDMQRDGVTDLTDEHIALIIDDFERACQHYFLAFALNGAWTRSFPWILMVLSHPVVETAWKWAGIIVTKFSAHTGPVDRRTAICLDPSSKLRPELDDFIRTKKMSAVLQFEVGLFRFVPLSDRPAEAEHVYLKVFVWGVLFCRISNKQINKQTGSGEAAEGHYPRMQVLDCPPVPRD